MEKSGDASQEGSCFKKYIFRVPPAVSSATALAATDKTILDSATVQFHPSQNPPMMRQASWSTPHPSSPPDFWHEPGPSD